MEQQDTQGKAQPIALPERTRETLVNLVRERERIEGQIQAIVGTARDCLGVPGGYVLRDVTAGFEPNGDAGDGGTE